jgi:hypothetical protein
MDQLGAKGGAVEIDRLIKVCHRNPNMMELHA